MIWNCKLGVILLPSRSLAVLLGTFFGVFTFSALTFDSELASGVAIAYDTAVVSYPPFAPLHT